MLAQRPTQPKNRWQNKPFASTCTLLITLLFSHASFAADARTDYDLDDDGLIEINDLADLNEIRNNLDGKTLYGSNAGCPNADDGTVNGGCIGFELTTDLDFDTNQDGVMDGSDDYWNGSYGWNPIGDYSNPFSAVFDGNGHVIRNLFINRSSSMRRGLFGLTQNALIRNLGLTGPLMSVSGATYVGALVGAAYESEIKNIFNTGPVQSLAGIVGGLVGYLSVSTLENAVNSGSVAGSSSVGGLVGTAFSVNSSRFSTVRNGLNTGLVAGNGNTGGLVGNNNDSYRVTVIENSYWASDASGQNTSASSSEANSYVGLPLATLQCAVTANTNSSNSNCVSADGSAEGLTGPVTVFNGWDQALLDGQNLWGFGNDTQIPAMVFNGIIYRDSDGDSVLDDEDAFPQSITAYIDNDADGHPDSWGLSCNASCIANSGLQLDQFPDNADVWQDEDLDDQPDSWGASCDASCQNESDLVLDAYPNDTDNDGIDDLTDTDDNNDGITDIDADSDGLVEINNLAQLNAMRYQLDGMGLRMADGGDLNQSGCPAVIYRGVLVKRCIGYELTADLDFDTNQDGIIDASDDHWNGSYGWSPIGEYYSPFTATFEGNGHVMRNLFINSSGPNFQGLFGHTENALIRNVGLTGPLMSVTAGGSHVGALVGQAYLSEIKNVFNTGPVQGRNGYVGGLVGNLSSSTLENAVNSGQVTGGRFVGGLAGFVYSASTSQFSTVRNGLSTGLVNGNSNTGGLIGHTNSPTNTEIENSYWAIDVSGQDTSSGESEVNSYVGLPLSTLQCAVTANTNSSNSNCVSADGSAEGLTGPVTVFNGWDQALLDGQNLWDFGNATQTPAMVFNGITYRDSDGDSVLDYEDAFPQNAAAFSDFDADGHPDNWSLSCDANCIANSGLQLDQFPDNADVWQDEDLDGQPDSWGANCDASCQNESNLVLDAYPNDTDNDGIDDLTDTDDNNDGITDIDANGNGLVDIGILEELNAMRYQLDGTGLRMTDGGDLDQSGCPAVIYQGVLVKRCIGYELTTDLDFDSNQDGIMDANDTYWNNGTGWSPIGSGDSKSYFTATFEGNGHVIRNLFINRADYWLIGLFGVTKQAQIRNIGLTGPLMSVTGSRYVGPLVGNANLSNIKNVFNTGPVQGSNENIGGLVGYLSSSTLENAVNIGPVTGNFHVGGLVGYAASSNTVQFSAVRNGLNTGLVSANNNIGGLIGYNNSSYTLIENSYWASDASGQDTSAGSSEANSYVGLPLATLQCAVTPNTNSSNSSCVSADGLAEGLTGPVTLFKGWDQALLDGQNLWNFGSDTQTPAMVFNGIIYRDSDGDSVWDDKDAFPLIPLGGRLDTDSDGIPNECDESCSALSMAADLDDDNDGVLDTADAFPLDNTEHSDFDNDGTGDVADLDDDNDGVNDVDDPNLGEDNGKPEIINVPSIEPVAVTTENGDAFELLVDDNFLNAFTTVDAVDTEFTYEASLNGNVLAIDENDIMLIPAGRQAVQVVAIDAAGNRSEPVEMVAIVYPQVRFEQATSIIGENSTTNIKVSLTGDAPDYPVVINFAINELSYVNQADLDAGFDITAQHQVIIEAGDAEALNRDGLIEINIIEDNESENDELLIVDLLSAKLESETDDEIESLFVIDETNMQHELTVTYQNLAPVVNLKLEQNGIEVANVQQDAGMVSITAIVQDGNGNDVHTLTWDLNNLGLNAPLGNILNFSPASLPVSTYEISVIATDNGVGQLSDDAVIRFDVVAAPEVEEPVDGDPKETEEPKSSGGSGGGAVSLWLMLLLFGLVSGVGVKRAKTFS
jgi:hypothetical protein